MKTLERITEACKALVRANKAIPVDSVEEALTAITKAETELLYKMQKHNEALMELKNLCGGWNERTQSAHEMMTLAETPEAAHAMQLLHSKADRFATVFKEAHKSESDSMKRVEQSLAKVTEAKNKLLNIQKMAALNAGLHKLEAFANIPVNEEPDFDKREINLLVHTATALAELKIERLSNVV